MKLCSIVLQIYVAFIAIKIYIFLEIRIIEMVKSTFSRKCLVKTVMKSGGGPGHQLEKKLRFFCI